ncbi:MAG: hypothetical protein IPJ39_22820 [Saprospiraceae bacterium]|nr:hypothetical protein [Saprospiraceae bacterium]
MWSLHFIENYLKSNNKTSDETEIQIDILRRRILEFEDCFELLLNKYIFSTERYPEIENIYQKLFDLYDLCKRICPTKSYLTNLYEYRQLIELERKLGYPLMRRPLELPIQTSLPSREPKFMQKRNEVEDILIRLNRDKSQHYVLAVLLLGMKMQD